MFCFVVYTPICLIRKIEKLAWTHLLGNILIVLTVLVILIYAFISLSDKGWAIADPNRNSEIYLLNPSTWLTMIGAAVYSYEGIGLLIPVLDVTAKPEVYPKVVFFVLLTVVVLYIAFGEFCLFVWGNEI